MKDTSQGKVFRFLIKLCVTLLLCLSSLYYGAVLPARADSGPAIPEPSADFYYNDQANILSDETKAAILVKNAELSADSIQLVVLTMDALPVEGYTRRVEYLRSVMQSWQVGGSGGRGLLLALSVSDEDYLAVAGEGLQSYFTTDLLKSLLDAQLEPDFSARAYDAGVSKFISEAAARAQSFAGVSEARPVQAEPESKKDDGVPILLWVALAAGAVAVVCIAVFLLASRPGGRRRYGSRRTVHRHTPLVTPPRTNVLRHENHTPIVIKSAHRGGSPTRVKKL